MRKEVACRYVASVPRQASSCFMGIGLMGVRIWMWGAQVRCMERRTLGGAVPSAGQGPVRPAAADAGAVRPPATTADAACDLTRNR